MPIQTHEIDNALAELTYDRDERKAPDEHRRSKFLVGWEDATQRHKVYEAAALQRLTWKNLGYRLGQRFGALEPADINAVFASLAAGWQPPNAAH
jgi:5-methylcytosine-specific restriction protein A